MFFRVLKNFIGFGAQRSKGEIVEFENSPKIQKLVEQRYLLPVEAEVAMPKKVEKPEKAKTEKV